MEGYYNNFDEPEISLHPQYIEALSDNICELGCNNAIIMSTHSNHLISSLIRNYFKYIFFFKFIIITVMQK
mgnify:CR=1 FL=1